MRSCSKTVAKQDFVGKPQHTLLVEQLSNMISSGQIEDSWPKMSELTNLLLISMMSYASQGGAWVKPLQVVFLCHLVHESCQQRSGGCGCNLLCCRPCRCTC